MPGHHSGVGVVVGCGDGLSVASVARWLAAAARRRGVVCVCATGRGLLRAKALVMAPLGVILSVGGAIVDPFYLLHERSLGESPIHSWTSVGGTIGVMPFLEASLLEIGFDLRQCCVASGGEDGLG